MYSHQHVGLLAILQAFAEADSAEQRATYNQLKVMLARGTIGMWELAEVARYSHENRWRTPSAYVRLCRAAGRKSDTIEWFAQRTASFDGEPPKSMKQLWRDCDISPYSVFQYIRGANTGLGVALLELISA
jgi:hypothetical protein